MAQNKVRTVPTFRAPTAYEEEMMRAQRQQQLAEMLRQQAFTPDEEPYTFQGFRATPSPANAIARVLSAYTSKKLGEKAEASERAAREADIAGAEEVLRGISPQTRVVAPDMFRDPMEISGKYTPPVTEMVTPTAEERRNLLMQTMVRGTPTARQLAQFLAAQEPKIESPYAKVNPLEATEESRKVFDLTVAAGKPDYSVLRKASDPSKPLFSPNDIANLRLRVGEANVNRALGLTNIPVDAQGAVPTVPTLDQLMAPLPQNLQNLNVRPATGAVPPVGAGAMAPPSGISYGAAMETGEFAPGRGLQYSGRATTASGQPVGAMTKPIIERVSPKEYGNLVAKQPVDKGAAQSALGQVSMMRNFIRDLQQHGGTDYIFGPIASATPDIRGSATSARSLFDTLRERSSVEALKQSRAEGFAPGSITEQEWPRFETAIGAIRGAKDPRAMRLALENADKQLSDLEQRIIGRYNETYGQRFPLEWSPPSYKPESSLYPRPEVAAEDKAVFDRADQIIRRMQQRRK